MANSYKPEVNTAPTGVRFALQVISNLRTNCRIGPAASGLKAYKKPAGRFAEGNDKCLCPSFFIYNRKTFNTLICKKLRLPHHWELIQRRQLLVDRNFLLFKIERVNITSIHAEGIQLGEESLGQKGTAGINRLFGQGQARASDS